MLFCSQKVLDVKVMRGNLEVDVQVKPEDLSSRLKRLREERITKDESNKMKYQR